jgi:hypothetical protein
MRETGRERERERGRTRENIFGMLLIQKVFLKTHYAILSSG